MKTQYEVFIDAVSCALEDHSFGTKWYFDFDEQTTVPAIEDVGCYPVNGHGIAYRIGDGFEPAASFFCI